MHVGNIVKDILANRDDESDSNEELIKMIGGLGVLFRSSDEDGVLISRAYQLFHYDPMPTAAAFLYAELHKLPRDKTTGKFDMEQIFNFVYENVEKLAGLHFIEALKPEDMDLKEY